MKLWLRKHWFWLLCGLGLSAALILLPRLDRHYYTPTARTDPALLTTIVRWWDGNPRWGIAPDQDGDGIPDLLIGDRYKLGIEWDALVEEGRLSRRETELDVNLFAMRDGRKLSSWRSDDSRSVWIRGHGPRPFATVFIDAMGPGGSHHAPGFVPHPEQERVTELRDGARYTVVNLEDSVVQWDYQVLKDDELIYDTRGESFSYVDLASERALYFPYLLSADAEVRSEPLDLDPQPQYIKVEVDPELSSTDGDGLEIVGELDAAEEGVSFLYAELRQSPPAVRLAELRVRGAKSARAELLGSVNLDAISVDKLGGSDHLYLRLESGWAVVQFLEADLPGHPLVMRVTSPDEAGEEYFLPLKIAPAVQASGRPARSEEIRVLRPAIAIPDQDGDQVADYFLAAEVDCGQTHYLVGICVSGRSGAPVAR